MEGPTLSGDVAGRQHWNSVWTGTKPRVYEGPVFEQHSVLRPYLETIRGGKAIEIGCVPGNWMVYLNKEYGLAVAGVDYSDQIGVVRDTLKLNEIEPLGLFNEDLFDFKASPDYDLVFSSGFVEHFDDPQSVIQRHADLAKRGGLVIIMVPNLTGIHFLLTSLFCPEVLAVHRLTLMYRRGLTKALEAAGLRVLTCDFQFTFRPVYPLPAVLAYASQALQKLLRILHLANIGNQFASPYLISVSRKP